MCIHRDALLVSCKMENLCSCNVHSFRRLTFLSLSSISSISQKFPPREVRIVLHCKVIQTPGSTGSSCTTKLGNQVSHNSSRICISVIYVVNVDNVRRNMKLFTFFFLSLYLFYILFYFSVLRCTIEYDSKWKGSGVQHAFRITSH